MNQSIGRKKLAVAAALVAMTLSSHAAHAEALDTDSPSKTHRLGAEIDLVQPFIPNVHIIRPKLTWTAWGKSGALRGDLVFGLYIRPNVPHDVLERINEYMITVGYRQYFWRGLHLEALVSAGAAWGTNQFDGQFYRTPTLFMDVLIGYRFGFFEPGGFAYRNQKVGFYFAPQFGTIFSLGVADIGPRNGKPDAFIQGTLLVGVSFR